MNPTFSAVWAFTCISKKKLEKGRCRSVDGLLMQVDSVHRDALQDAHLSCDAGGPACLATTHPHHLVCKKKHCDMRTMFKTLSLSVSSEHCLKHSKCVMGNMFKTLYLSVSSEHCLKHSKCVMRTMFKTFSLSVCHQNTVLNTPSVSWELCLKHSLWVCHQNTV